MSSESNGGAAGDWANGDRPSAHGKLLGLALSVLAKLGRRDAPMEIPAPCLTCAFTEGTFPNQCAGTGKVALDCVLGIDRDPFACHHGMKEGQPSKICVGYIAARLAPFSLTKEVFARLHSDLAKLGTDDDVRAGFDRWLETISADDKADVYRLARKYAADAAREVKHV